MTDIPGNTSTTASVTVGSTTSGTLEAPGDHDWYKITLTAGQAITVTINGVTLEDPYLYIRDSSGNPLYQNDDISAGIVRDSRVSFTAAYTGTYYIDVGAFQDNYSGTYQVVVQAYNPPPLATYDQIANQLTSGYWSGDSHHFNVSQGGTITVNISALNASEKVLARAALAEWTDIIGVQFKEVTSGGQILFDNTEDPTDPGPIASTDATWSFGIISSAHVQISTSWVNTYGTGLNSYSFQTYIHEIGHALGLGHAGNYNGNATYPYDASFQNDAWTTSIMSYFSQHDNSYFDAQGFSEDYAVTPMLADILAMQQLYGLSTTTRTGDTTYGYNSNAGNIYNANLYPNVAYTIFDSGGTDTLDFSGSSAGQLINLNAETFSNVNGNTGNLAIARGVVIENAFGGSGSDTITGNAANNFLKGGAGDDNLSGGAGDDTLIGGAGSDVLDGGAGNDRVVYDSADDPAKVTGGAGTDTLVVQNLAAPTSFNLAAQGFEGAEVTQAGSGSDPWSTIVYAYDASWRLSSKDLHNADGTRTFINLDESSSQSWSQDWFAYDAQGRLDSEDVHYDDGTRTFINLDQDASKAWNQDWFAYDGQGRLDSEDVHYDDGTRTFINLDQAGTQSWSQDWFSYDAQGRLVSEDRLFDDGTHTFIRIDAAGSESWSQAWFTYDAQGRLDTQDVINDDGSRTFTNYDQAGTEPFSVTATLYHPDGTAYEQVTTWDDGHTTYTLI